MEGPRGRRAKLAAVPTGLLGMLVLVVAVEQFLASRGLLFCTEHIVTATWSARAAGRQAASCGVLILGDSLLKIGMQPRVVERALGLRTINLGVIGGQAPATVALLRKALRSGARPQALVVDFKANIISQHPGVSLRMWPEILDGGEIAVLAWRARDARLFGELLTSKVLYSLRARAEVRQVLLASLGGTKAREPVASAAFWRNEDLHQGALITRATTDVGERVRKAPAEAYYPAQWFPDPVNVRYMRELFQLARTQKIRVFWVLPPIHQDVQRRRVELGLDQRYRTFVRYMQRLFPEIIVIDGGNAEYPEPAFYDASHLVREGGAAFSASVAAVMSSCLGNADRNRDRWVALPAYQEPASLPPLEDLEASLAALGGAAPSRR